MTSSNPKPAKGVRGRKAPSPVMETYAVYRQEWQTRFSSPYPCTWGKDLATIKRLAEGLGGDYERLKELLRFFVRESRDPFAVRSGFSLGSFSCLLPALQCELTKLSKVRETGAEVGAVADEFEQARLNLLNSKHENDDLE